MTAVNPTRGRSSEQPMRLQTERDKTAHLLRRFGLGASEAELEFYGKDGLTGAIDKLLDYENSDEGFGLAIERFANDKGMVNIKAVQAWWMLRLVATRRPLQEKMTVFWHDHFATSAAKVDSPIAMQKQNEIIRKNAVGSFYQLLSEVSKDPAMMFWLDNQYNVKGKPNENFAREVMELFTLGIGNYTEKDVQEAARAFTGWAYGVGRQGKLRSNKPGRGARFTFDETRHDDGMKTVLGKTDAFDGDGILGLLCSQPRTAKYITEKIWEWFVYPKPEPDVIDRMADTFRKSGLEVKALLRAIMLSPEFYSDKAARTVYKNPVDFTVSTIRQLGLGRAIMERFDSAPEAKPGLRGLTPIVAALRATKAMGMELLYPPDVAGWDTGSGWISSATMVERMKWADTLFGPPQASIATGKQAVISLRLPAWGLLSDDPTPLGAAKKLVSVFDAELPAGKISQLAEAARAASGGEVTAENASETARCVSRLIFGTPEFQFC